MSRLTALLLLVAATAFALLVAGGASATEPNDAYTNATPISAGTSGPFEIDPIGDEDWYAFQVTERANVRIVINGSSGDPNLYLYDENVSYVAYNSYATTYPWPAIESFLEAGLYYAVVADEYGYNNFTGYYITLEVWPAIPLGEAFNGPFNVNSTHLREYFVFDVGEASNVRIALNGTSGDPEMYLYDVNFTYLDWDGNSGPGLWSLMTNQLYPNTYYLMVQVSSGSAVVDFFVNLERVSLLGPDGNGLLYNATAVYVGMNGPFDISYSGDIDWYLITFASAGIATFETNGSAGSTYLALYDQNGSWLGQDWSSGYGSFSWMAATVEAQTYYIDIESPYLSNVYNYTLEIQVSPMPAPDFDNDRASATGTDVGTAGPFSLVRNDVDWYSFTAAEPGTLTAETNGPRGGASVTLYDALGNTLAYGSNTGNASFQAATALVDAGTVLIEVRLPYNILAQMEYNLTVTFTPWVSQDGNDFRSRAQPLAVGLNGPYSIQPNADADWYYFQQEAVGSMALQVYGGNSRATIELYNATGAFYTGGTYGVQQISTTLQPGLWYVRATSTYGSYLVGEYYLNLTLVDTTDPAIMISGPANGTQVDQGAVRISGRTEGGARVWVGGEEVFVDVNGSFSAMVPVVVGQNAITVTAVDAAGNTGVTVVQVTGVTLQDSLQSQLNAANAQLAAAQAQLASANGQVASLGGQLAAAQAALTALQSQLDTQNGTLAASQQEASAQRGTAMFGYILAGLALAAAALVAVLMMRRRPPAVTQTLAPVAPAAPVVVSVPTSAPAEAPTAAETAKPAEAPRSAEGAGPSPSNEGTAPKPATDPPPPA